MRLMRRRQPRGYKPVPLSDTKPLELPRLIGETVELYLQGEPLSQDEKYLGKLLYVTGSWLGFVDVYRTQLYYDHIPLATIRKIRDARGVRPHRAGKMDPFRHVDFDREPEKVIDLTGQDVVMTLQGHPMLKDAEFRTRLLYVKKNWVGVGSFYTNRTMLDHIPVSSIRRITKIVLLRKPGRFVAKDR